MFCVLGLWFYKNYPNGKLKAYSTKTAENRSAQRYRLARALHVHALHENAKPFHAHSGFQESPLMQSILCTCCNDCRPAMPQARP